MAEPLIRIDWLREGYQVVEVYVRQELLSGLDETRLAADVHSVVRQAHTADDLKRGFGELAFALDARVEFFDKANHRDPLGPVFAVVMFPKRRADEQLLGHRRTPASISGSPPPATISPSVRPSVRTA